MLINEDFSPRPSPLRRIIPIVTILGLFVYGISVLTGSDRSTFYEIGAGVAILVYILTFVDIILGIAILIACVGLSPEVGQGDLHDLRLEDFIIPVLFISWIMRAGRERADFVRIPIKGPAIAFFLASLFSSLLAATMDSLRFQTALLLLGKNLEYYVMFLIIANNVKTEREFKALVIFQVLIAIASSFVGYGNFYDRGLGTTTTRVQGPEGESANIFGGYLLLNIGILIGLYLHARTTLQRFAALAGSFIMGLALLYTYSRTSYAALAAAVGIFGLLKHRPLLVILLIAAVLFPLVAPATVWNRASTIGLVVTEAGPESWVARVDAWHDVVDKLAHNPLFGMGIGAVNLGDVDNEYVRIAADMGLVGLGLFLWLLIRIGKEANRVHDSLPPQSFARGYAAGFMVAFFGLLVHGMGATSFTSIRSMEGFMILTGLFVALSANLQNWDLVSPTDAMPYPSPARDDRRIGSVL